MTCFLRLKKIKYELRRRSFWKRINGLNFNVIILVLIVAAGLLYLVQINSVAAKGFEIKDLEKRIETLKDDNKNLELKIAELQSHSYLAEKIKGLNMVAVSKVDYLIPGSTAVAYK
ncbi:MAG: septum formation initiator family protein [Patescibacteria group bacterium]|nr:septum formation initiator family protein [Patescibacteria group bacterium]MDD5490549.1 septum formation initiator family protein [Patescibacteria group bacterium]